MRLKYIIIVRGTYLRMDGYNYCGLTKKEVATIFTGRRALVY